MRKGSFASGVVCALVAGAVAACATAGVPVGDDDSGAVPQGDSGACTTMCSGACVDTKTDKANCGKCGVACPSGATCVLGACQCDATAAKCSGVCVDTTSDNANCGKCGLVCGADAGPVPGGGTWGCKSGACAITCPAPKTECSGACVDTKTDPDNCGSCGTACMSMTEACVQGLCCPTGQTVCGGMCTDTQTDAKNCGMCGNACPQNMPSCAMGQCTASMLVEIFPPSGTLKDPGNASVWGGRYYTMKFSAQTNILAIEWKANLSSSDTIRGEIWNPSNMQKLATGTPVNGNNMEAFQRSTISFTAQANTPYLVGVYMSNANTVFPRKDSPSYPFTVGTITVSACWSTSTANTDIFPTASNIWGPDFKLEIQ